MDDIKNSIQQAIGLSPENQDKILYSLLIFVVLAVIRLAWATGYR
jgi:hypothetical protein